MPKVTLQQVFDAAWQHFIVEGHGPCVRLKASPNGTPYYGCSYRSEDGTNKCAIGLVIPDEAAEVGDKDCLTAYDLSDRFPDLLCESVLSTFAQRCLHDDWENSATGKWTVSKEELRKQYLAFAGTWRLTVPGEVE